MILNLDEYRQKVLGCWMGKNIGGTLGAPFEWIRQVNNVSFYTQKLDGNPLPNDDLDIQLLWLIAMEENGIEIDSRLLSEYFLLYLTPHWGEYGISKMNMKSGHALHPGVPEERPGMPLMMRLSIMETVKGFMQRFSAQLLKVQLLLKRI